MLGGRYCNRTVDKWAGCWPDTLAGTQAAIHCHDILTFNTKAFAYKECFENGTWNSANYTQCRSGIEDTTEKDLKNIYIFIGGISVSLVMLLISLTIFFRFKQLRCDRITIHKNFFLSYVFTDVSWILYYVLVTLDGEVMMENPIWCRFLHVICQYFTACNFLWMFCEGLYLNTIMVYAFNSGKLLIVSCYIIGWGVPLLLTGIYVGIRSQHPTESVECWMGDSSLQWIVFGPIILSIVINAIFLINIVRLLITKLRQMPEVTKTKKATRATLILIPLLGLQYLLLPLKPPPGSSLDEFYHIAVALFTSLQGAFVSTVYCFCNGEVIAVMTRKYRQKRLMRKRSSLKSSSGHLGMVYTTIDQVPTNKDNSVEKTLFEAEVSG